MTPSDAGYKGRILVVDDTPSSLKMLMVLLGERGYIVHPAKEGGLALRFVQAVLPDLILLDIRMPDMDGYEVCARLKADPRTRDVPVIFLSSVYQVFDKVKAFRCGAVDYVTKPFEIDEVLVRIETHISLRRLRWNLEAAVQSRTAEMLRTNQRLQEEMAEREHAEEEQRKSERRFEVAFRASRVPMGIVTADEGRYLLVNDAYLHMAGYAAHEVLGRTETELGLWCQDPSALPPDAASAACGEERTYRARTGELRSALFFSEIIDLDSRETVLFTCFDITARNLAKEQLRQSSEEIRKLYDEAPCGYHTTTQSGVFVRMNATELRWLGYARDEVIGKLNIADVLAPSRLSISQEKLSLLAGQPELHGLELEMIRKDRSTMPVLLNLVASTDGRGEALISADLFDITARKGLEEQFRQAQKMEAVGRLAGGVAHDFNNLLTVIGGYGEMLAKSLSDSGPLRRQAEEIVWAADRAGGLTRQLLAFSRKQVIQPKTVDLNVVVGDIGRMAQRLLGEDIEIRLLKDPALGQVMADPDQINQVLLNLLVNARDAMPDGGTLTVETANVEIDESFVAHHPEVAPGRYVLLAVADTGVGMDQPTQRLIFEPFFTTKESGKGTGLGLATVWGVVRQSGGWIWVYSEPGQGATFKVYLPRTDAPESIPNRPGRSAGSNRGSETVLVVEDESEVRKLTKTVLETYGYTVLDAGSGTAALALAASQEGIIHLLLTDVVLPGMNGKVLATQLQAVRPEMRVLFASGYTADVIAHRGIVDPGLAYLPKPFSPDGLAAKVREVLDGGVVPIGTQ